MTLNPVWTVPVEIELGNDMGAQRFNEQMLQNLLYINNRPYDQVTHSDGSDWTTTSTAPIVVDSDRYLVELDTLTGNVEININLQVQTYAGRTSYGGIEIDGDYMLGDPVGAGGTAERALWGNYSRDVDSLTSWNATYRVYGLTAGVHTFSPMLWCSGGNTAVLQTDPYTNIVSVREI